MKARILTSLAAAALTLTGCGTTEPIPCTDIFVYGLSVDVVEAGSGAARADGATLTVQDGSYVESTTDSFDGRTMVAAGERAGTYLVTVSRPGYHTWARSGVVVRADECHVIPVALIAELEALD